MKPKEKMMKVIFRPIEGNTDFSVDCKNTDIFVKIEELFYDKYPEYNNTKINFVINGEKINILKNVDYNEIKDSDIIIFENIQVNYYFLFTKNK